MSSADHDRTTYRPAPGLVVVPVAQEAVVFDRRRNALHRLDATATAVWSRLDGRTATRDVVAGLAGDYRAPAEQVRADVHALLDRLSADGLVVDARQPAGEDAAEFADGPDGAADEEPAHPGPRRIAVRATPCLDAVTALGWGDTELLELDGHLLSVRSSDDTARASVRAALPGSWSASDAPDLPNLSVRAPEAGRHGWELSRLYAECTLVARGRTTEDVLDRLRDEVAGRIALERDEWVAAEATLLRRDDELLLAPWRWFTELLPSQGRLRASGWELVARHVVLQEASLAVPRLDDAGRVVLADTGSLSRVVAAGQATDGAAYEDTAAARVAALAAACLQRRPDDAGRFLTRAAALVENAELVVVPTSQRLIEQLAVPASG